MTISKNTLKTGIGIGLLAVLVGLIVHARYPGTVDAPIQGPLEIRKKKKDQQEELLSSMRE